MKIFSSLSQELRLCDCILNVIKYHIPTVMIPASSKKYWHEFAFCRLAQHRVRAPNREHLWKLLKTLFSAFPGRFFFGLLKAIFVKANTVEPVSECLAQKLSCRKFQGTESYSGEFLS